MGLWLNFLGFIIEKNYNSKSCEVRVWNFYCNFSSFVLFFYFIFVHYVLATSIMNSQLNLAVLIIARVHNIIVVCLEYGLWGKAFAFSSPGICGLSGSYIGMHCNLLTWIVPLQFFLFLCLLLFKIWSFNLNVVMPVDIEEHVD